MAFEYPLAEPGLILIEREIPVARLPQHGFATAEGTLGVDKVGGIEGGATGFALVSVGTLVAAVGASASDVAVGKELVRLFIIILLGGLLDEFAFRIELLEIFGGCAMVLLTAGAAIDIKRDAKAFEAVLDDAVVAIYDVLWRDAFLASLDGDGDAVLIAAAYEDDLLALGAKVAHVDVGRDVDTCQVANMHGTVGIGQSRSDGVAAEVLVFLCIYHVNWGLLFML